MPIYKSGERPQLPPVTIDPATIHWEENDAGTDNPRNRLLAHVKIGPLDCHLEAIAVTDKLDGTDQGADAMCDRLLDDAYMLAGEGKFDRMEIDGQEYVVFMTPYQG